MASLSSVQEVADAQARAASRLVGPDGRSLDLSPEVFDVLSAVAGFMAHSTPIPRSADVSLTTGQAAELLGMSRPTLVKLLDAGALPYTRGLGGGHRRLLLSDVLCYRDEMRARRREALEEMRSIMYESGTEDVDISAYLDGFGR